MITPNLSHDRLIEWSFVLGCLPSYSDVLDIGCNESIVPVYSSFQGNKTVGIDLVSHPSFSFPLFSFIRGDFLSYNFNQLFDCVVLCSTLEHIGLTGRYNSTDVPDGDFQAMSKVFQLLKFGGLCIVTIPVGVSSVIKPFHRIYDKDSISRLFFGFDTLISEFYHKLNSADWEPVTPDIAFSVNGSKDYYSIGCFLLRKSSK